MVVTDPKFIATRESITGQVDTPAIPALQTHFGATDPVGLVHVHEQEKVLEDLFKGQHGDADDNVLSGGRQRRGGKRQDDMMDVLANRGLNGIMNDILMQQTMDMMDRIIELGREIEILDRRINEFDEKYLSEEERAEMAGMTEAQRDAYRLERAAEKVRRGEMSQEVYNSIVRDIREREEKKEELAEFVDENIDQIRQTAFRYNALVKKREELSTKIAQNDTLSTRLGELRAEGENERTTQELDGIIRTRSDLEIRLSGDETYYERIDAVDAAVEQQTIKLTQDLGEVGSAIETMEEADEKLTGALPEKRISLIAEEKGHVQATEEASSDFFAEMGLKDGFQSAHNDDQPIQTANVDISEDVKPIEIKPITFGNENG